MSCLELLPRESLFCLRNMAAQCRFAKLHLSKALDSWNNVLWTDLLEKNNHSISAHVILTSYRQSYKL